MVLRRAVGHLRDAGHQFGAYSTAAEPLTISPRVAQAISLRPGRLTRLPPEVEATISAEMAESNRKSVRANSLHLTDKLKHMSRSKHRGGAHPNFLDEAPPSVAFRALRGKRRQREHRALAELAQRPPITVPNHEALPASYWGGEEREATAVIDALTQEVRNEVAARGMAGGALYNQTATLAYAVSRMPACYAALHRVLLEVERASGPGWRPESMLDFGAGPGTASWAANAIWPGSSGRTGSTSDAAVPPVQVTAVEPSGAMTWLGHAILERYHANHAEAAKTGGRDEESSYCMDAGDGDTDYSSKSNTVLPPRVRYMSKLPPRRSSSSASRKYDIVVAGYLLSELQSAGERRRAVADLWARAGRFLVLVEPGTPSGAANILAARAQVLQETAKSAAMEGAHVAAPCPHDGPCPLAERASWCHFAQKFERADFARSAKLQAGRLPPRAHQDERFSYVVMARGARAPAPAQVYVAGALPAEDQEAAQAEYLFVPSNLKPKRSQVQELAGAQVRGGRRKPGEDSPSRTSPQELKEELRRLMLHSIGQEDDSEDEEERGGKRGPQLPAEVEEELERSFTAFMAEMDSEREEMEGEEGERLAAKAKRPPKVAVVYGEEGAAAETAAREAAASWSRLLRQPRKRSGHVVLDLCSAVDAEGQHLGGDRGVLLRQIVSRGKALQASGGLGPVKLARRARWGDQWPLHLQSAMGSFEPPSVGLEESDDDE